MWGLSTEMSASTTAPRHVSENTGETIYYLDDSSTAEQLQLCKLWRRNERMKGGLANQ